jgi:hypothetical protein
VGGNGEVTSNHDLATYCSLLGDQLEKRAATVERLRPAGERIEVPVPLAGNLEPGDSVHYGFLRYITNAAATLRVAWMLGMRCAAPGNEPECRTIYSASELSERGTIDTMIRAQQKIRDALHGRGPCVAGSDVAKGLDPCEEPRMRLEDLERMHPRDGEMEAWWAAQVLAGKMAASDISGLEPERLAAVRGLENVAEARALIDYGAALLSFCAASPVASSCTDLGADLDEAGPDVLAKRAKSLRRALRGTPREAPSGSPP